MPGGGRGEAVTVREVVMMLLHHRTAGMIVRRRRHQASGRGTRGGDQGSGVERWEVQRPGIWLGTGASVIGTGVGVMGERTTYGPAMIMERGARVGEVVVERGVVVGALFRAAGTRAQGLVARIEDNWLGGTILG